MHSFRSKVMAFVLLIAPALLFVMFYAQFEDKVVRKSDHIVRPIQRARMLRPVSFTSQSSVLVDLAPEHAASSLNGNKRFSLALVRTISTHDAKSLLESFETWEDFALGANCRSSRYETDLIISFCRVYDEELYPSITNALKDVNAMFAATDGWGGCIRSIKTFEANISPDEDLYSPSLAEKGDPMWVNGPNR